MTYSRSEREDTQADHRADARADQDAARDWAETYDLVPDERERWES